MELYSPAGGCKYGLDAALEFYSAHGTPWVALYEGKPTSGHGHVLFHNWSGKYEEVEDVANVIRDRFDGTGSSDRTKFTLSWWDEKPAMSAKKLPLDRPAQSVQFVLSTPEQVQNFGAVRMMSGVNSEFMSRLAAVEERLNEEQDNDEQETNDAGGVVGALMQNPAIMQVIQGLIMRAVDKIIPAGSGAPVALAGVDDNGDKLGTALQILKAADPELEDDLMRLAILAQNDPGQFQFLLKMLRK